ncbi:MAG TPA: hypothetical protein VFG21_00495 [Xanthomonadaceae bacterium]|nr:hypothetical protein [Xanthomonadaceae bacterium]
MRIALVTAIAAHGLDEDMGPLLAALQAAAVRAEVLAWDDPTVSWARFDAALLRSTWDYARRHAEFLAWCERVGALTRLLNPLELVRWNSDKHYLAELERAGVAIVPTVFLEPGADPESLPPLPEFVVKPAVGAGSRDAARYRAGQRPAAVAHARRLLDTGRSVMVQPYLAAVDAVGETAMIFHDGRYSHAVRKDALLHPEGAASDRPADALFAAESIAAREPDGAELELARRVLAACPDPRPAYARVDVLPAAEGPRLLELELVEPSLFFAHAPGAADRFVQSLLARLH